MCEKVAFYLSKVAQCFPPSNVMTFDILNDLLIHSNMTSTIKGNNKAPFLEARFFFVICLSSRFSLHWYLMNAVTRWNKLIYIAV